MKNLFNLTTALLIFSVLFPSFCIAKEDIAPPYIDTRLTEYHFNRHDHKNILGYQKDKYILLSVGWPTSLYDMDGNLLKKWNASADRARLLKNCNLMLVGRHNESNAIVRELDPKGNLVWEFDAPEGFSHHDFDITDEGHIAFFHSAPMPKSFQLTNLCKHEEVLADKLLEIDKSGKKYFEWPFYEHFPSVVNQVRCTARKREHMKKSNFTNLLDAIHPNGLQVLGDNKWYRQGYEEFKPGNFLVTTHHLSEIFIIDKESKRVVWIYQGEKDAPLDGPHEARMIPEGMPGAGNILIHDNGKPKRKYSRILEINPITKKTVWKYQKPGEFFNKFAGSQQRLDSGDTFISEDQQSRVFIVNKKGEMLWQFLDKKQQKLKRPHLYLRKDFAHCLP